ncbi:MAG: hypothetical protein GC160_14840 [Acidobacteria bacterium]|nr:hypothetical protein [Acidobacteriota bacterium]
MRRLTWIAVSSALLAGCAEAPASDAEAQVQIRRMYEDYRADFPAVEGVSAAEALRLADEDAAVFVDIRTPEEQAVSKIPGALTAEQFESDRESYRGRLVVAYCTIGARSGKYAKQLQADGFDVRNLEGGVLSWTHAGGPLVDDHGPTPRVHVYGSRWNLASSAYQAVW